MLTKIILLFPLLISLSLFSDEYPTLINPDGSPKFQEYNKEELKDYEGLLKQIGDFHDKINQALPFVIKNYKLKDSLTRTIFAYEEVTPGNPIHHFIFDSYNMKISGDKVDTITFFRRKSRMTPKYEEKTVTKEIINKVSPDMKGLVMKVTTRTPDVDPAKPQIELYKIDEMFSPSDRIFFLRDYRIRIEEIAKDMDKLVEKKVEKDRLRIKNTLKNIGG